MAVEYTKRGVGLSCTGPPNVGNNKPPNNCCQLLETIPTSPHIWYIWLVTSVTLVTQLHRDFFRAQTVVSQWGFGRFGVLFLKYLYDAVVSGSWRWRHRDRSGRFRGGRHRQNKICPSPWTIKFKRNGTNFIWSRAEI